MSPVDLVILLRQTGHLSAAQTAASVGSATALVTHFRNNSQATRQTILAGVGFTTFLDEMMKGKHG